MQQKSMKKQTFGVCVCAWVRRSIGGGSFPCSVWPDVCLLFVYSSSLFSTPFLPFLVLFSSQLTQMSVLRSSAAAGRLLHSAHARHKKILTKTIRTWVTQTEHKIYHFFIKARHFQLITKLSGSLSWPKLKLWEHFCVSIFTKDATHMIEEVFLSPSLLLIDGQGGQ